MTESKPVGRIWLGNVNNNASAILEWEQKVINVLLFLLPHIIVTREPLPSHCSLVHDHFCLSIAIFEVLRQHQLSCI